MTETRFQPRPGLPGQVMLTHFVCDEGHEVVPKNSPEKKYLSKTDHDVRVECPDCGDEYRFVTRRTLEVVEEAESAAESGRR